MIIHQWKKVHQMMYLHQYDKLQIVGDLNEDKIQENIHRERMKALLEGPINSHYSDWLKEKDHETRRIRLVSMRKSRSFLPS